MSTQKRDGSVVFECTPFSCGFKWKPKGEIGGQPYKRHTQMHLFLLPLGIDGGRLRDHDLEIERLKACLTTDLQPGFWHSLPEF